MHTDFWKDLNGEAAVGEYLLSNLWSQLGNSTCQRVNDLSMQKLGVDVILSSSSGKTIYIDEKVKCQASISQPMYERPSVEVLQDIGNPTKLGWWVNDKELTHAYCFINLSSDNHDFHTLEASQIEAAEVVIFRRDELKQWLEDNIGKTDKDIIEDAASLVDSLSDKKQYSSCVYLKKSSIAKKQRPINLVLPLDTLKRLPHSLHLLVLPSQKPKRIKSNNTNNEEATK